MLIETINQTISDIENYKKSKEQLLNATKFNENIAKLSVATEKLDKTISIIDEIKAYNICSNSLVTEEIKQSILSVIDDCGSKVADYSLTKDSVAYFQEKVNNLVQNIDYQWKIYSGIYASGIVEYLGIVDNLVDDPQKARQLKQTIKMQTTDAPKSKDEVAIFAQAVHDAKAIVDLLQVDDQIRNFLIKVSSKTATILDLNQSVLDWITKHKLQSRIKVTF